MIIRTLARPMLGSIFVYGGYNALIRDPSDAAERAKPLVTKLTAALPDSRLVPKSPEAWVRLHGGTQMVAGLMLCSGKLPRSASLLLAGSQLPSTMVDHPFWSESDPAARQRQRVEFLKEMSIVGGLLIAGFDSESKPGLMWRAKRAVKDASASSMETISALLPTGDGGSSAAAVGDRVQSAADSAKDLAGKVGGQLSAAGQEAGRWLNEAAAKAAPVAAHAASTVSDAAGSMSDAASTAVKKYTD